MNKKRVFVIIIKAAAIIIVTFLLFLLGVRLITNGSWVNSVADSKLNKNIKDKYDIIVFGGDPEGVAAAVAAARLGADVLLLSYEDGLGGLMTYGMLNSIDMNTNSRKELVTKGIFQEFHKAVGGDSFDVGQAKSTFRNLVKNERNITYVSDIQLVSPVMEGNTIMGVKVIKEGAVRGFFAERIIDATQDADVVAAAGAPYKLGQEDNGLKGGVMCSTLVFKVLGVDWEKLKKDIKDRTNKGIKNEGINRMSAWGFGELRTEYKPLHANMKLRGLNVGKQNDGSVLINALQIFNVNALDQQSKAKAIEEGKLEIKNVIEYLKNKMPAFSKASFGGVAQSLYIRESRHITGQYVLKANDVLNNVDFEDKIAIASYPIDIQATNTNDPGMVLGNPDQYSIPLRCLIPLNVENAFVVGRSASYSSLAAGSARVLPVGMVTGQAAGVAAMYSIGKNTLPSQISKDKAAVLDIQNILIMQGAYLPTFNIPNPNSGNWAYLDAEKLLSLGLLRGGYQNDLKFKDTTEAELLMYLLVEGIKKTSPDSYNESIRVGMKEFRRYKYVERNVSAQLVLYLSDKKLYEKQEAWNIAKARALLSSEYISSVGNKKFINNEEAYNLVVHTLEKISGRKIEI